MDTDTQISMVQGDAAPSRVFALKRLDGSIPDLTNYTGATFKIYRPDTGAQTNASADTCTILTPKTDGKVQYDWSTTDLPVAGTYRCILQIVDSNGKPESNIVYITVESDTN